MITEQELFRQLGLLFQRAGHQLFLVGGSVRDRALGRPSKDLDFTTDALPDDVHVLLIPWADAVWDIGREFGTIAANKGGLDIEITTFRSDGPGRKPEVEFTNSLEEDLKRRDFTINAMALPVNEEGLGDMRDLIDPFGGFGHLVAEIIDTPRPAEQSFDDDPLRMLRAARFVSQLDFKVASRVDNAMQGMAHRIDDISRERVAAEMDKLLMGHSPEEGLHILEETHLLERFLPGITPGRQIGTDSSEVIVRWARLLGDQDPQMVVKLLRNLKFSSVRIAEVAALVDLTNKFQGLPPTDEQVRVVIHESSFLLPTLLEHWGDPTFSACVEAILKTEGVPVLPVGGKEIIETLGLKRGGPIVGTAQAFLWQCVLDGGPMTKQEAIDALKTEFVA